MRQRWQRGEGVLVEAYLEAYPALGSDTEAVLDLIYNEFVLRRERGELLTFDEYMARMALSNGSAISNDIHHLKLCITRGTTAGVQPSAQPERLDRGDFRRNAAGNRRHVFVPAGHQAFLA